MAQILATTEWDTCPESRCLRPVMSVPSRRCWQQHGGMSCCSSSSSSTSPWWRQQSALQEEREQGGQLTSPTGERDTQGESCGQSRAGVCPVTGCVFLGGLFGHFRRRLTRLSWRIVRIKVVVEEALIHVCTHAEMCQFRGPVCKI